MSGFAVRDGRLVWDVLDSKVHRWHDRHCGRDADSECRSGDTADVLATHATGFTVGTYRSGRARVEYLFVEGPGIAEGTTDRLYEAITGEPGRGIGDVDPAALLARAENRCRKGAGA